MILSRPRGYVLRLEREYQKVIPMHANRATSVAVIAGMMAWGLLAATAGAQPATQQRGDTDTAWRRATPNRDSRDRFSDDRRQNDGADRRPAPQSQPVARQDQARGPVNDREEDDVPPPPLRGTNTASPRPRDTQEWRPRNASANARPMDQAHANRAEAPRNDHPGQSRESTRDNVRQVQYQAEVRKPAPSQPREQPYEWHPGRDQAPRAKPTAMTEAPAFNPNTAAPKLEPTLAPPLDRRGATPPPEYRVDERQPNYRAEANRMAASNPRPARDRVGEPIFMSQNPRPRGPYRPTSANAAYELPPGGSPSPQAEIIQAPPRSAGQPTYQGQPVFDGSSGAFDVDGNGYPADGYGYGDDYDDGYGGYSHSSECYSNCAGPCDYCATCCGGPSCPHRWFEEANLFAGVHSFQGGLDQGQSGNFGFQEGVNLAGSLWHRYNIGYQVGGMAAQSNLSGSNVQQLRENSRSQTFLTAGLFRRAICNHGFQGGAVFDWLDDRYYSNSQFAQLRAELSYLWYNGHEFGFWGAFNTGQTQAQTIAGLTTQFAATDLYAFFYRKTVAEGGQARVWGGGTGNGDGLFGADFRIPMSNRWDFVGGFNYLIPKDGPNSGAVDAQSWGISMNIVWYPTRRLCGIHNTPFRQLFNVADNNVFMIRQQ
jgi:hypothetical protein